MTTNEITGIGPHGGGDPFWVVGCRATLPLDGTARDACCGSPLPAVAKCGGSDHPGRDERVDVEVIPDNLVIRVYDAGNVMETHEHTGDFQRTLSVAREAKSRHAVKRDG
ncbi:MAG: hypothetical protein ACJ8KF_15305 [Chthoniobacterales bacterium]